MALDHTAPNEKAEKAESKASQSPAPGKLHSEVQESERSNKPAVKGDVASKEDAMFKSGNNAFVKPFENTPVKPVNGERASAAKAEPKVLDLGTTIERPKPALGRPEQAGPKAEAGKDSHARPDAAKPAASKPDTQGKAAKPETAPNSQPAKSDGQAMVDSSKQYWEDEAKRGRSEGGLTGAATFAAAKIMGLGADAAIAGHRAYTSVFSDGAIEPARQSWQDFALSGAMEGGISGSTKQAIGVTADALLQVSGLGNVESGLSKVAKGLNQGAPEGQLGQDVKALTVDTTLAALTFIPGVTGLKAISRGDTLFRTAAAGTEIAGMAATDARLASSVGTKINTAISEALPAGEKVSKAAIQNFIGRLEKVASEYGINFKKGGIIGESNGTINTIEFSTKAGGKHEVAHVSHQLQSRATALEAEAAKHGKTVQQLTQAERTAAYESIVKPFENVAYNQHEMFAGAAHAWGRTSKNYSEILRSNVSSFEKALSTATVLEAKVGLGAQLYGRLPDLLGRSQIEIGKNLLSPKAAFLNSAYDRWKDYLI